MNLIDMLRSIPEMSGSDLEILQQTALQMQYMADLSNTDIFLDCPIGEGKALVVAHAQPASGTTVYEHEVTGEIATAEKEPAVFTAIAEGMPICDIKAETQEGRPVRQNVCPVKAEDGRVIGVLIRERTSAKRSSEAKSMNSWRKSSRRNSPHCARRRAAAASRCGRSITASRTICSSWPVSSICRPGRRTASRSAIS